MKVFFQGKGECIVINGEISVTVLDIDGDEVVLEIDAPEWLGIAGNQSSGCEDESEEWSPLQSL